MDGWRGSAWWLVNGLTEGKEERQEGEGRPRFDGTGDERRDGRLHW